MTQEQEHNLKRRAITGFWRFGGSFATPPCPVLSSVVASATETVVILRNEAGVVALYRQKPSGKLRRLLRCPKWLRAAEKTAEHVEQANI